MRGAPSPIPALRSSTTLPLHQADASASVSTPQLRQAIVGEVCSRRDLFAALKRSVASGIRRGLRGLPVDQCAAGLSRRDVTDLWAQNLLHEGSWIDIPFLTVRPSNSPRPIAHLLTFRLPAQW